MLLSANMAYAAIMTRRHGSVAPAGAGNSAIAARQRSSEIAFPGHDLGLLGASQARTGTRPV